MEGDLPWGGEHTIQHTDDVLWTSQFLSLTKKNSGPGTQITRESLSRKIQR